MNPASRTTASTVLLVLAGAAGCAHAATFTVTRFDDPVPNGCQRFDCSLREAVVAANASAAADTIVLGQGTYALTQAPLGQDTAAGFDLDVSAPLTVTGQGAGLTFVRAAFLSANLESRVFSVRKTQLTLDNLALRGGRLYSPAFEAEASGGCVFASDATLTLNLVDAADCRAEGLAAFGGALGVAHTVVELVDVELHDNAASSRGGAIQAYGSTLDLASVRIEANQAYMGGGIHAYGDMDYTGGDVVLTGNRATLGGALSLGIASAEVQHVLRWNAPWTLSQNVSTLEGGAVHLNSGTRMDLGPDAGALDDLFRIEDNHAGGDGGGLFLAGPAGNTAASRLVANRLALRRNTADGSGGAVSSLGSIDLADSEVADNVALGSGGGLRLAGAATDSRIVRVSLARNAAGINGGAAAINAAPVALDNVSTHANTAGDSGGGLAVATRGSVVMNHVTSHADSALRGGSLALASSSTARMRNTVLAAGCHRGAFLSVLDDLGGNAQQKGQPACAGTLLTAADLALAYASHGGLFDVVGIGAGSRLRNLATSPPTLPVDIRGWARGTTADTGAFEYDAARP